MKVLMQNRPDAFSAIGGDTIQMLKTAEYLRREGIEVDTSVSLAPDLNSYDIIHLMNITRVKFTYTQLLNAKKHKKRVVLSPIYWNTHKALSSYVIGGLFNLNPLYLTKDLIINYCNALFTNRGFAVNEISEIINNRRLASIVLAEADCLLPNSRSELELLKSDFASVFKRREKKAFVVPNGVDSEVFGKSSPKEFMRKHGLCDFVLCVGRFGFRKNQLYLIRAMKDSGVTVVFIGDAPSTSSYYWVKDAVDRAYYQKCRNVAGSSCVFLPQVPHNALASAYTACKVFVLPSFYETPGLVALEAAVAGATICITKEGSTHEYFQDFAYYCDPYNLASIRDAVLQAYNAPKNKLLKKRILENFTWQHVAKATLKAYQEVMKN